MSFVRGEDGKCTNCAKDYGSHFGKWCTPDECGNDDSVHDEVTNPKHYDLFPGIQAIDVIKASLTKEEYIGYLKGNVLKYRLRAGEKGPADKCLAKANWYREKLWGEYENHD